MLDRRCTRRARGSRRLLPDLEASRLERAAEALVGSLELGPVELGHLGSRGEREDQVELLRRELDEAIDDDGVEGGHVEPALDRPRGAREDVRLGRELGVGELGAEGAECLGEPRAQRPGIGARGSTHRPPEGRREPARVDTERLDLGEELEERAPEAPETTRASELLQRLRGGRPAPPPPRRLRGGRPGSGRLRLRQATQGALEEDVPLARRREPGHARPEDPLGEAEHRVEGERVHGSGAASDLVLDVLERGPRRHDEGEPPPLARQLDDARDARERLGRPSRGEHEPSCRRGHRRRGRAPGIRDGKLETHRSGQ